MATITLPILGQHPSSPHPLGDVLASSDSETTTRVPFRSLSERDGKRPGTITAVRGMLLRHHASPDAWSRSERQREAFKNLGFESEAQRLRRIPINPDTRKGNFAEILLAEYVAAASNLTLPVYRLRYNPNVEQSMKGDDVLAFDLDADPVRVVVGEAKFRAVSTSSAVVDIVEALVRSHKAGVPTSLQFVADRLFDEGKSELGARVLKCAILFAQDKLQLDYVGLLMSDSEAPKRVINHTPSMLKRLAMISFSVDGPDALVSACYDTLA